MIPDRQEQLDSIRAEMFPPQQQQRPAPRSNGHVHLDDHELLERMFAARNGANVRALYDGDTTAHNGDDSAADLALCGHLAFYCGPDPQHIDRLFRQSRLMRSKWDSPRGDTTYGQITIAKALAGRTEFYSPASQPNPNHKGQSRNENGSDKPKDEASGAADSNGSQLGAPPARTDLGNARHFATEHAHRLQHVRERRMWLAYDGTHWRRDATGYADRAAKQTIHKLLEKAVRIDDADQRKAAVQWALASQSERGLRATLALAATEPEIALAADQLDRDPWLLACPNGTLDLRTRELRPHNPADLITLATDIAYEPGAACPRWRTFLKEIFADDTELIAFVQRFAGYCLTGDTREHVLAVLHGAGCNGKSTFIGIQQRVLGDFAITAAFDTFTRARGDRGPRNDLARLHRARLVTAAESGEGRRLDEATVKEITGGDRISARFLYGEHFEYRPQFKLALVTNHRPRVDGDDDAIWRRLRLIPFEQGFEGREDRELDSKLQAELPGILAWAVQGCQEWQQHGLGQAAAVTRATTEYRQDEDLLGAFIEERCLTAGEIPTTELRNAYENYCKEVGDKPLAGTVLGRRLAKRGIRRERQTDGNRAWNYHGISLR